MGIPVGIIGFGAISRFYINALRETTAFRVVGIYDSNEQRLELARQSGLSVARDVDELIKSSEVEAIIICLPNDLHCQVCKAALVAGKHVCCEKPLALSVEEARKLTSLAEQRGRTLLTSLHRRYNRNVRSAKRAIGGRRVRHIDAYYLEKIEEHSGEDTWYLDAARCGGGCIADNGPNLFGTISMFIDDVAVVDCRIEEWRNGIDMRARVQLCANDGTSADARFDWGYEGERKELDIALDDGHVVHVDMLAGFSAFKSSLDHEYVGILADFGSRIMEGRFAGGEGLRAVELVDAAYQAAAKPHTEVPAFS
jgi:predicted dehydrogenase